MTNIKRKLNDAYEHAMPYIEEYKILTAMCRRCERYMGKGHDYADCKNEPCFECFLAYAYLEWTTSYE